VRLRQGCSARPHQPERVSAVRPCGRSIVAAANRDAVAPATSIPRTEQTLPPFVTLVLIPSTFSITQGMLSGFLLYVILLAVADRANEVRPALWAPALISAGLPARQV
jgi:xanthine/uracil/vitamin C permease (AzgA family)